MVVVVIATGLDERLKGQIHCRESSGADRPWTVGTELLQPSLYDDEVCTPEALRATLLDNETRAQFVASTEHDGSDNQNGN